MNDLYIYYQVPPAQAAALRPAVLALQARLAAEFGVQPQLKRRPPSGQGAQTWMEVYPAVDAGFQCALDLAVRQAGLDALCAGPRHTEVFMDFITCA